MNIFLSYKTRRSAALAAGAVLAALLASGCAHDDTSAPPTVVTTPPSATVATPAPGSVTTMTPGMASPDTKVNVNAGPGGSTGTDAALSDAVNTAIVHNKQMTGSRIEPVATGGVVTLTGQVQNQQQKALAEKTATQTPGVLSVKNKLIIVSTGGAKPKPIVITKTKTIVVHDHSIPPPAPADTNSGDTSLPPTPAAPDPNAAPTTP